MQAWIEPTEPSFPKESSSRLNTRLYVGRRYANVQVHKGQLQERQKQVFNLIDDGKWVCFLVRSIVDSVPQGDWDSRDIDDTDLCKKILNALEITRHRRRRVDGLTIFNTKSDEFKNFLIDFGIVNTVFELPYNREKQFRIIASSGNEPVATEWANRAFFLPFHTTKRDVGTFNLISTEVSRAILGLSSKANR